MQWDVFCTVIDNYGDAGVCWRLTRDLAARGERVRLWLDDATPLSWMAPDAAHLAPMIEVLPWQRAQTADVTPGDVVIEAFGCELPDAFVAQMASQSPPPAWINLEYLSAEGYVERCHALPSPVMNGPGRGLTKHFFYPGFTDRTGGLLRPAGLAGATPTLPPPSAAQRRAWLDTVGLSAVGLDCRAPGDVPTIDGERWVSLFCYEPTALAALVALLAAQPTPHRLWVTQGRATAHLQQALNENPSLPPLLLKSLLSISYLPPLTQVQFDALLDACDVNFVRGEDSLVRALWAGRPTVWQIYPQDDGAHAAKLLAYLEMLPASPVLRDWHLAWNAAPHGSMTDGGWTPPLSSIELPSWADLCADAGVAQCRARLWSQADLGQQLMQFAREKRASALAWP